MQYDIEDCGRFKMVHIIGNIENEEDRKKVDADIARLILEGSHHFVFNLERTTYLDSAGISIFIHCLCDIQENGGSIYLIAGDNTVREVLDLVGITRLIKTYTSSEAFLNDQNIPVS